MTSKHSMEGALYGAPVRPPRKVLDLATGTGTWAIDIAREHRQADVAGTDLSLKQLEKQSLPVTSH